VVDERREGDELLASIVESNVRSLAWTTDQVIAGHVRDKERLARALLNVLEAFDEEKIVSRRMLAVVDTAWARSEQLMMSVLADAELSDR
jgi:hypothetical protein